MMILKKFTVVAFCLFLFSSSGQSLQWTKLNGPWGGTAITMGETSSGRLLLLTSKSLYTSDDHGKTWVKKLNSMKNEAIRGKNFLTTRDGSILFATKGVVYKSLDNGNNWKIVDTLVEDNGFWWKDAYLYQRDKYQNYELLAWTWGHDSNAYYNFRSTDTGLSWSFSGGCNKWFVAHFYIANKWDVFAGWDGLGVGSFPASKFTYKRPVYDVCCDNKPNLYLLGENGRIFYSDTFGMVWNQIGSPKDSLGLAQLACDGHGNLFTCNSNHIYYSGDKGNSWSQKNVEGYDTLVHPIDFYKDSTGTLFMMTAEIGVYYFDPNSKKWMPSNNGINDQASSMALIGDNDFIYQNAMNGFPVSKLSTLSGGEPLPNPQPYNIGPANSITNFEDFIYLNTPNGIYRGNKKYEHTTFDKLFDKNCLDLIVRTDDSKTAWILDSIGNTLIYNYDGTSWKQASGLPLVRFDSWAFGYKNQAYLFQNKRVGTIWSVYIYSSTDAGKSWKLYNQLDSIRINTSSINRTNDLLISVTNNRNEQLIGLQKDASSAFSFLPINNRAYALYSNNMWNSALAFTNDKTVWMLKTDSFSIKQVSQPGDNLYLFSERTDGSILAAGEDGFYLSGKKDLIGINPMEESQKTIFELFPNPAKSTVSIQLGNLPKENYTVDLYSSDGRFVRNIHSGKLNEESVNFRVNISDLPSGSYLVEITSLNIKVAKRLSIQSN